ncbi:serine hydrolase domain-containing protein [Xanthomonas sp. XNM01]|uniref:serine hydrolase domain-containing protein n=1 Tax=Xanthomonas sp. XNM01 TaxID=2769289 RepID=UPI001786C2DE|nr:serine hydrolase domain-containing protein [Xanthomonas sp. XNM01]MBD9367237.1 beta-lactamase family protein [Xanthomonas sp. XNM01]
MKDAHARRPGRSSSLRSLGTRTLIACSLGLLLGTALPSTAQTPTLDAGALPPPIQPQAYRQYPAAEVKPLAEGFDIARFEAMAEQLTYGQRVPGLAVAIVHDGRILSARGYGVTDVVRPQQVDAHTVFRLASLSKAFAGTMAGLLVNDGSLRWDSKVADYVPGFHLGNADYTRQVTVADLLSHSVGLKAHNAYDRDIEANAEYYQVAQKLGSAPLACAPGDCYAYQNVAFSLVGDVVFAASGNFYEQAVQRRLFEPLGMHDASLGLAGIESSASWARPHVRSRNGWVSLSPKPTYYRLPPAAGVNASASDMAQWLLAHTGHRPDVLSAPLLATLHAPVVSTPGEMRSGWRRDRVNAASYALGWRVFDYAGEEVVFHAGAVQGYRGLTALLPGRDLGIAILWNSESPLPSGLLPTIIDQAVGLPAHRWLDVDFDFGADTLMAENTPADADSAPAARGASSSSATASPH